jgi:hypothetical protein
MGSGKDIANCRSQIADWQLATGNGLAAWQRAELHNATYSPRTRYEPQQSLIEADT